MMEDPIKVEELEIEGDTDLYGLITVTSDDGTVIEVTYDLADLSALNRQIGKVCSAIIWHRATWLYTSGYGRMHLARKTDRKILCGATRETGWYFYPLSSIHQCHDLCKRCQRIFDKAEG